jgi:hypothetical protein
VVWFNWPRLGCVSWTLKKLYFPSIFNGLGRSYTTHTKGLPIHFFLRKTTSVDTSRPIISTCCILKLPDQSESVFTFFLVSYWLTVSRFSMVVEEDPRMIEKRLCLTFCILKDTGAIRWCRGGMTKQLHYPIPNTQFLFTSRATPPTNKD